MQTSTPVIAIDNLHFGYSFRQLILDRLQLAVPQGAIYGFLGANGAGKSTTIRSIMGLLTPHKGQVRLFGKEVQQHRLEVLSRVGSLIEAPSFYKHLSAYNNLKIAAQYLNIPFAKIEASLELVNLQAHSHNPAGKYSTGMKQRLGMAMALLSDPELLILDEPTNGLDPTGMIEFRTIIQRLHDQKKTIFLSSHLLGEIEKIATHVGVIKHGNLIFQGTIEELEQRKTGNFGLHLHTTNDRLALELIRDRSVSGSLSEKGLELELLSKDELPALLELLISKGIQLHEVRPEKRDLEKLFISLTQ